MSVRVLNILFAGVVLASVGCGQMPGSPIGPEMATVEPGVQASGSGGTVKETLTGPAINGVVPEGQALADMSQFPIGGNTILTVQVKKVNLQDGTVLSVTLDFTPVGTITLSRNEGTLVTSLGHFGVSNDKVRVYSGTDTTGTPILSGGFFQ